MRSLRGSVLASRGSKDTEAAVTAARADEVDSMPACVVFAVGRFFLVFFNEWIGGGRVG